MNLMVSNILYDTENDISILICYITIRTKFMFIQYTIKLVAEEIKHSPMFSLFEINPNKTWLEPWRFITYGFMHNSWSHLFKNMSWQIAFGLPLELSNGSIRVGSVFLSGIFLGGLGRELATHTGANLTGASGELPIKYILRHLDELT